MNNKPSLLLIAHGSRSDGWNRAIAGFARRLEEVNQQQDNLFRHVEYCFLEHAKPDIKTAIENLCGKKAETVIAFPLFLSASVHVLEDIPNEFAESAGYLGDFHWIKRYRRGDTAFWLLEPINASDLLTENLLRRFNKVQPEPKNAALVPVYYGSKKYPQEWEKLTKRVEEGINENLPDVTVRTAYGGDAVDLSPEPLSRLINELAQDHDSITILPALLSVGIVQTKIIPQAIQSSGAQPKVTYPNDAILPDEKMVIRVFDYCRRWASYIVG